MSDANEILADQLFDIGMDYVAKVIQGSQKLHPMVRSILVNGIDARELCAARAGMLLIVLQGMWPHAIEMQMTQRGVRFALSGLSRPAVTVDWLMLLEASDEVLQHHVINAILPELQLRAAHAIASA